MKDQHFLYFVVAVILLFCATSSEAQQWTPDPFCPFPSDHVTRYPYYGNCSVYWECYEGTKYVMPCPEGLEFNAPLQQCDTPEIAKCDPLAPTTENPNPPTWTTVSTTSHEPGPDCPYPSDELIYYPYEGDCTKYWECYEGDAYLYNCPEGLWWHEEISQCDYPGDFCTNTTTSTHTTTPTTSTPSTTTDFSTPSISTTTNGNEPQCNGSVHDQTFWPYPGDCTKYWECSNGKLYLYQCPDGLWWNQQKYQCDFPGDYCDGSTIESTPTTASTTTITTSTPDVQCGDDDTYLPDPNDCHLFFECVNGKLYEVECPEGLYYSESLQQCVFPEQSECCQENGC